ncbi:MAG: putative endonuclease, partial [Frankiales bacterium]|nr:putative endonuclease [Frankiales bacterium]
MDITTGAIDPGAALAVIRGLLARDVESQPVSLTGQDLRDLQEIRNLIDADFLRCLGVFDARGGAELEHHLGTRSWLRVNCRMSATTAHGRLLLARRLRRSLALPGYPFPADADDETQEVLDGYRIDTDRSAEPVTDGALGRALATGAVSYEHAMVIARTVDKLPDAARPAAETLLVGEAPGLDPTSLGRLGERIAETLAPELLVQDAADARAGRYLHISRTFDGKVRIDGLLDADDGAVALAAVNGLATPTGPEDTRTPGQRRADAFTEVLAAGLRAGELPQTSGVLPHVTLTVDIAPLIPGASGIAVGRTATGLTLVGAAVERILCDADLSRVVTAGASEVLDVGRRHRLATPAQRRGL